MAIGILQAAGLKWSPVLANGSTALVQIEREGELLEVLPMWIAVHQEEGSDSARCGPQ